jgi:hypothetical protein
MSIEQNLTRIADALEALVTKVAASVTSQPTAGAEPAGKPRKAKTETAPGPTPPPAKDPVPEVDDFDSPPADEKKYTKDDVRAALVALQKKTGSHETARGLLAKHGAKSLSDLKETSYAAVIAEAAK